MGFFDEKKYLTGDNGLFKKGDEFTVFEAELTGTVKVKGQDRKEARLRISADGKQENAEWVYTSGMAIVGAIERQEPGDFPAKVKLDSRTTTNGEAHILVQA